MFYRTNLTLSALSNRLNLGTRSLVQATSLNHGDQALRFRHPYHDVMRDEDGVVCRISVESSRITTFRAA